MSSSTVPRRPREASKQLPVVHEVRPEPPFEALLPLPLDLVEVRIEKAVEGRGARISRAVGGRATGSHSVALVVDEDGLIMRTDTGGGDCQSEPLMFLFADGFETGDFSRWSASTP